MVRGQGPRGAGGEQGAGRGDPGHRPGHAVPDPEALGRRGRAGGMIGRALCLLVALATSGCASHGGGSERSDVIRRILPSAVQLRTEREGGARRAASGIVLASDARSKRCWILTTRHFLDPAIRQDVSVSTPTRKGRAKAVVKAVSPDLDLAVIEAEGISLPPVRFKEVVRL